MTKKAIIIFSDGFEEIEAITIIDLLRRAYINVKVCGLNNTVVTGAHEVKMTTDLKLSDLREDFDALILPGGGENSKALGDSAKVRELVQATYKEGKIVAAICASPGFVLAPAGVLDNKNATGFPGTEGKFGPKTHLKKEAVVVDGNIITSRGPATAFAFSFTLIEKLAGKETMEMVRKQTLAD